MVLRYDEATGEVVICRGGETDWYRNLQAHPATHVTLGGESFSSQRRPLTEERPSTWAGSSAAPTPTGCG